ncbi:hypothetical protein JF535_04035 [Microbulbifer salipaludis]|uniref:Peptidase M43 pregnancy-associated plasma-A domain-containing protein n=1 Tax=Microbulbifer salipaludis TaxID=187980 RepID=A0ABS3E475_9GAMM|nr:hypothetical protein [Microbulbifer salipaludis]MBN8430018.1 hypothetical protein [Microbulbifer salipaludis]
MPALFTYPYRALRILFVFSLLMALTACGGGGGTEASDDTELNPTPPSYAPGDSSDSSGSTPSTSDGDSTQQSPESEDVAAGNYATLERCLPFAGNSEAPLKVLFANLDGAPYFDQIVQDAVENQFQGLPPFSEYSGQFAFYQIDLQGFASLGCSRNSGGGFYCDIDQIHSAILQQCGSNDIHGVMKVVIAEGDYGASGGEIIYVASDRDWQDSGTALHQLRNIVIHEVGHNFGLADLYDGGVNADGTAVTGWPSELSRAWANLDGPGCAKWCNSFKPASEYTQSANATCPTLTDKASCTSFNRSAEGECETDDEGNYTCCGWSEDTEDDYFGGQCTPAWGTEDIGQDCLQGTGCFYGGAYGNNSWRPAKSWSDSIMYGAGHSQAFDAASERALRETIRCCATSDDATSSCASFRADYLTFLQDSQPYKNRVGSCGISS